MPELRHRQDFANWTTPLMGDVLLDSDNPALTDETLHRIQSMLVIELVNSGVDITASRSMPYYALFETRVKSAASVPLLRDQLLNKLAARSGWLIGTQLHPEDEQRLDILVRTGEHRPVTLRQVIARSTFRKAASRLSFVLGVNLQQQILVRDFEILHHLLVVGSEGLRHNAVRSWLVTLLLTNTPTDLRIALVGSAKDAYPYLSDTPHLLGEALSNPSQGMRLLAGMVREAQRRSHILTRSSCQSLEQYNESVGLKSGVVLPRIVLVLESLYRPDWLAAVSQWLPNLTYLLKQGAQAGIHLLMIMPELTTHEALHPVLLEFKSQFLARNVAEPYTRQIAGFHQSLLRFVDAFIVEETGITPVELPLVAAQDMRQLTEYWHKDATERMQANQFNARANKSGLTSLFQSFGLPEKPPMPPVPAPPPPQVLAHAATVLSHEHANQPTSEVMMTTMIQGAAGEANHSAAQPELDSRVKLETTALPAISEEDVDTGIHMDSIRRAHALASYLGWLGRGPLMDVLGMSQQEAELVIAILQARRILERSDTPTPRLRATQPR